jgi:integrase
MKARGMGALYVRGRTVWVQIHAGGRKIRMSTGVLVGPQGQIPRAAKDFYVAKLAELGRGLHVETRQPTFRDLGQAIEARYSAEERQPSLRNLRTRWKHLERAFGGWRAQDLTDASVLAYAVRRRDVDGAAVATVNLELRLLRRAFRLLRKRIPNPPDIPQLPGAHVRRGTVPDDVLEVTTRRMKPHLAAIVFFLRLTGWRSSEPLRLEWRHIDWEAQSIRLERSKNGHARERAFGGDRKLKALLRLVRQKQRQAGIVTPWVFCGPRGKQVSIYSLRSGWTYAARKTGYSGGLHNFRRTRIREQEMQQIPPTVGMSMTGIRTFSVYRDYAGAGISEQEEWLRKASADVRGVVQNFKKKA